MFSYKSKQKFLATYVWLLIFLDNYLFYLQFLTKNCVFFNFGPLPIPCLQISAKFVFTPFLWTCSATKVPKDFLPGSARLQFYLNMCFSVFGLHVLGSKWTISFEYNTESCKKLQKNFIFSDSAIVELSNNDIGWVVIIGRSFIQ